MKRFVKCFFCFIDDSSLTKYFKIGKNIINHLDKKTWRSYNDGVPRKLGNTLGGFTYEQRRYFRKKQAREQRQTG